MAQTLRPSTPFPHPFPSLLVARSPNRLFHFETSAQMNWSIHLWCYSSSFSGASASCSLWCKSFHRAVLGIMQVGMKVSETVLLTLCRSSERRWTDRLQKVLYGKSIRDWVTESRCSINIWNMKKRGPGLSGGARGDFTERHLNWVLREEYAVSREHRASIQQRQTGNGNGDKHSQLWNSFSVLKSRLGPQLHSVT